MTLALALLLIFITRLEAVLAARNEVSPEDEALNMISATSIWDKLGKFGSLVKMIQRCWGRIMVWVTEKLEAWSAPKPDKQIAWTLGIGWACCGGGLAGGCLVFAKAT